MTIARAIEMCDRMRPNKYEDEDKIAWLSALDAKVKAELMDRHEGFEGVAFDGYGEGTPADAPLLIQGPYEDIYLKWLFCQIDFHNAEIARYNNSVAMYNFGWQDLANWMNRTYKPKQSAAIGPLL